MDDKTFMTNVSEAKVAADLASKRIHVFTQSSGKAPVDMIAMRDNKLFKVQVKSCEKARRNGGYNVQLRKIRHNSLKNTIHRFDPTECDVVAVYLVNVDIVCYVPSSEIGNRGEIVLRLEAKPGTDADKKQWMVDSYKDFIG